MASGEVLDRKLVNKAYDTVVYRGVVIYRIGIERIKNEKNNWCKGYFNSQSKI